ncbi:MAG: hypothetical protein IPK28_19245 [Devosia sp.]|nr:hypothetical protein [Devosia sp.]
MERRDRPTGYRTTHRLHLVSGAARLRDAHPADRDAHLADIAPMHAPEAPMAVTFEGLTPAQQAAAIAAFPGGRRFVLAG